MMASCEAVDDFQDIDGGDMFGACLKGSAADGFLVPSRLEDCNICSCKLHNPRVLSCLHVFCEECINTMLIEENGDSAKNEQKIICPSCRQESTVSNKAASSLTPDYISCNILEPLTVNSAGSIQCTSCKSKDVAMAYCKDCSSFLCPNCVNAHQYMRCFDDHKVVKWVEMDDDDASIHRPIYCRNHSTECLKFFCFTCQVAICNECNETKHKPLDHVCELAKDAEIRIRKELESLMKESQSKEKFYEQASSNLENALGDLEQQRDTAKDLIMESYQSYKAVLEKCRDSALNELDSLHSDRELKVMELFHKVEKTVEKIEDACEFTSRLLQHGNCHEVIALKQIICAQFLNLINNPPKSEVHYLIEFETSFDKFESTIKEAFGELRTESTMLSPKDTTPPPTRSVLPAILNHTGSSGISLSNGGTNSLATSSPISLPTSMQSSFDSEISTLGNGFNLAGNVLVPDSPGAALPVGAGLQLSSIAEYNLQQLASLAEKTETVTVSNKSSPSPSFSLADLFTGDISSTNNALNNLQALAKLGLNGTADMSGTILPSVPTSIDSSNNVSSMNLSSALISPISDDNPMGGSRAVTPSGMFSSNRGLVSVKLTPMQIRCKFGQLGATKGQFNSPHGFCLGIEEDIIVADTNNHRIEVFEKTGTFKFQFGIPGKEEGQLWYPRKVAVMRSSGKFVVCDRGNERSRMQIFTKNGHFIKKIGIRYIDIVAGLAVTAQGHIVAVDSVSPTVFVIAESGDLLHWFDCSDYMREPSDIAINGKEYFVCDFKGHCVVVFSEDGVFQRRIGGENITNFPNGIDISDAGDVLIGDSHGNRFHVAVFSKDGTLVSEFECPYVKVSRCCGLKITSEGYIVTLAKNNHHVLVLNTLYIL